MTEMNSKTEQIKVEFRKQEALRRLLNIALQVAAEPDNEITYTPAWFILDPKHQILRLEYNPLTYMVKGPFFSRRSAEEHLRVKRHHFTDRAIVWCASMHDCPEYRELYLAARAYLKEYGQLNETK